MAWSFSIGRLFGSDIRIHATFFLLLLWIGLMAYAEGGPVAALTSTLFILALFACVVAHEFGHALTARRYGIRTPDITLLPIGGMARLEKMPDRPAQEILVALAGPAVNMVIWAALSLIVGVQGGDALVYLSELTPTTFLAQLAAVNLFLAVFNLLPAFPMDGGRVLRALLQTRMPRPRATEVAARAGQVVALLMGFAAFATGNMILLLIAGFIFIAGSAESKDVSMRAATRRLKARDAMITSYESLAPTDPLQTAATTLIRTTQHEFPVLAPDGTLKGFLTRNALFVAMAEDGNAMRPIGDLMDTDIPRTRLDTPLEAVTDALGKGAPAVVVCSHDDRMLGYITRENLGELMILQSHRPA
ncbi:MULTISPECIES: site-2 protease family protein [Shimia]|uniref:site-2 protease family protein n=1 Tax=Shimia TaxID=573139 RepID=UPI001FB4B86B|nr:MULTISPECIES: site-2 protease family protein [Shimia]MDV4144074.1 site-2 protease family protein [Shimia sp. FJ5]